jgi:hypothetical protein
MKDENGNLLADFCSVSKRWNHVFNEVLITVIVVVDISQTELLAAEPLVLKLLF